MSYNSEKVKEWRKRAKQRSIDALGGCCVICGYNHCNAALAFHHLDPAEKEFGLGDGYSRIRSWARLVVELRKCVLLCYNCHIEYHAGVAGIPVDAPRFNEDYAEYRIIKAKFRDAYCVCGNQLTWTQKKYCGIQCRRKWARQVAWDSIDLQELYGKITITAIADKLGVSDSAVHKRLKKLGLK